FVNGYRISWAKAALADPANGRLPILTIAYDAGFASLAPFNRAFRAEVGQSPRDYRARVLATERPIDPEKADRFRIRPKIQQNREDGQPRQELLSPTPGRVRGCHREQEANGRHGASDQSIPGLLADRAKRRPRALPHRRGRGLPHHLAGLAAATGRPEDSCP